MRNMTLILTNQITKKRYVFEVEEQEDSRNYYHFSLQFTEPMDDGEFSYELLDEADVVVSNGVLQVGDYNNETNNEYNTETNEQIRQYRG